MLEKLFTSKNRIKIISFLFFEKTETYLREISKELKISPSAVKREIENLEIMGIIKKQKNKIILNEKSNILEELKNIFIKTDFIVYPVKKIINKLNKIKFALIFGSFAKGKYSGDSDIDLLIIGEIKSFDLYKKIRPIEDEITREINPVVWTIDNLKKQKNSGFVKEVFANKIIMIKGEKNELQKIIRWKKDWKSWKKWF